MIVGPLANQMTGDVKAEFRFGKPSGASCDLDADVCTVDVCDGGGTCEFFAPVDCEDFDACTEDSQLLVGDARKGNVDSALRRFQPWLKERFTVVRVDRVGRSDLRHADPGYTEKRDR